MRKIGFYLCILSLMTVVACNDYQKVLKSPNPEYKYKRAVEYYQAEEYYKALPLLEELMPLYKGTDKGQEIYFYWCYANYHLYELITASYHFKSMQKLTPTVNKLKKPYLWGLIVII